MNVTYLRFKENVNQSKTSLLKCSFIAEIVERFENHLLYPQILYGYQYLICKAY